MNKEAKDFMMKYPMKRHQTCISNLEYDSKSRRKNIHPIKRGYPGTFKLSTWKLIQPVPVNRDECNKSHPRQKYPEQEKYLNTHWLGITPPNRKSQTRTDSNKAGRDQLNLDWQIVTRIDMANIEVTCGMGHTWSLETRVLSKQCSHQQQMQAG